MDHTRLCLAYLAVVVAFLSLCVAASGDDHHENDVGVVEGMPAKNGTKRFYKCPREFLRRGNSCYFLSRTMATWEDAHFQCRDRKAHLATFEKRSENRNMRLYLQHDELTPLERWIGGMYQGKARQWVWASTSGTRVAYKAFPKVMVTHEWTYHCLTMDPASKYHWRPRSCLETYHYICEAPLKTLYRHHDKANRGARRRNGGGRKTGAGREAGGSGPRSKPTRKELGDGYESGSPGPGSKPGRKELGEGRESEGPGKKPGRKELGAGREPGGPGKKLGRKGYWNGREWVGPGKKPGQKELGTDSRGRNKTRQHTMPRPKIQFAEVLQARARPYAVVQIDESPWRGGMTTPRPGQNKMYDGNAADMSYLNRNFYDSSRTLTPPRSWATQSDAPVEGRKVADAPHGATHEKQRKLLQNVKGRVKSHEFMTDFWPSRDNMESNEVQVS